jgi:hypothetical protein
MHRSILYGVLLASGFVIGVGCNRTDNQVNKTGEASREMATGSKGVAYVRYVSAIDAHSGTDLYFGDMRLFNTTKAEEPTGYKEVPAARHDFILKEAGKPDGMEIEKNSEGLSEGKHYTVVGYEDNDGKPVLRVFNDDESAPDTGKAKIRLIHAAAGANPVSVWAPGHKDKYVGESRFSTASTWQQVDPAVGPFELRVGDEKKGERVTVPTKSVEAGRLYTWIVEGGPKSGQPLRVVSLVDSPRVDTH